MKRLTLALVPAVALGLGACQKQPAPERTADAARPAATAAPAEAGAPSPAAATPAEAVPAAAPAATPRDRVPPPPGGARSDRPAAGGRGPGPDA
jgi:hypothetical protein